MSNPKEIVSNLRRMGWGCVGVKRNVSKMVSTFFDLFGSYSELDMSKWPSRRNLLAFPVVPRLTCFSSSKWVGEPDYGLPARTSFPD